MTAVVVSYTILRVVYMVADVYWAVASYVNEPRRADPQAPRPNQQPVPRGIAAIKEDPDMLDSELSVRLF